VLRGILVEITIRRAVSSKRGVRITRKSFARGTQDGEAPCAIPAAVFLSIFSFLILFFFKQSVARGSLAHNQPRVASTRRSKFDVYAAARFGRLPRAASSSGSPDSRARAISREREFSLLGRVVRRSSVVAGLRRFGRFVALSPFDTSNARATPRRGPSSRS